MKIRTHVFALGKCVFCGARQEIAETDPETGFPMPDTRTCVERDIGSHDLRPEPKRREYGCEDFAAIQARIAEIREAAKPLCTISGQLLERCLRSSAKCGESCHNRDDWTGPAEAGVYC